MVNVRNSLFAAALALTASFASATPIAVNATGSVTVVSTPDGLGTSVGDPITLQAHFDSSALVSVDSLFGISVPGVQFASLATDPAASLVITLGLRSWSAQSEPFFGDDFFGLFPTPLPHVVFVNGAFFGLNFFGIGPSDDVFVSDAVGQIYFGSPPGEILGGNSDPNVPPFWVGLWDLQGATISVPEPGTHSLMLLGLMMLPIVGWSRRRALRSN